MDRDMANRGLRAVIAAGVALGAMTVMGAGAQAGGPDPNTRCDGKVATMTFGAGENDVEGTEGDDVIISRGGDDDIDAKGGDDTICASSGNDNVFAGGGEDVVMGGKGRDHVDGGSDNDLIELGDGNDGESAPFREGIFFAGGEGNLRGDDMFGGSGDDWLEGNVGNDHLNGGGGEDTCDPGTGGDDEVNCELDF